jgi:uncharacterized membrane protein YphA (DoxX/SURF4 family)
MRVQRGISVRMSLVRRIARPMLASMFITGGLDGFLHPEGRAKVAESVARPLAQWIPGLPADDPVTLVRINSALMCGAGTLLALGRVPRLAALAVAGTLAPTTVAGHRFWEYEDPEQRRNQRTQFFKNLSMLGGLLIAAADTEGRPSVGWRMRHAREHAQAAAQRKGRAARRGAALAAVGGKAATRGARVSSKAARRQARLASKAAGWQARQAAKAVAREAKHVRREAKLAARVGRARVA